MESMGKIAGRVAEYKITVPVNSERNPRFEPGKIIVDANEQVIAHAYTNEHAAFICRAVNAHENLVKLLREAQTEIEQMRQELFHNAIEGPLQVRIRAALAAAKEDGNVLR